MGDHSNPSSSREIPPLVVRGLELFNAQEYFEAHEVLETAWREEHSPVRELYRGILQIGVGYFHLLRGNYVGALKMFERSKPWIEAFPDDYLGINLGRLKQDALVVENELRRLGPERIESFNRGLLKPIEYQK
jgi:uncharacterized protein